MLIVVRDFNRPLVMIGRFQRARRATSRPVSAMAFISRENPLRQTRPEDRL